MNNWWKIDLLRISVVFAISIIGRVSRTERLNNLLIGVSQDNIIPKVNQSNICGRYYGNLPVFSTIVCQRWTFGRYVSLIKTSKTDSTALTLCEVDIFGIYEDDVLNISLTAYNNSDYTVKTAKKAYDCYGNDKQEIDIRAFGLKNFTIQSKGIGLKDLCNSGFFLLFTTIRNEYPFKSVECELTKASNGYLFEKDLQDTCTFHCSCKQTVCKSINVFTKIISTFTSTKEIYLFLKIL